MYEKYVLLISANKVTRLIIARHLGQHGFEVATVDSASRAHERLKFTKPRLLIIDQDLPDVKGLNLLNQLREYGLTSRNVVMLLKCNDQPAMNACLRQGVNAMVLKPVNTDLLQAVVTRAFELLDMCEILKERQAATCDDVFDYTDADYQQDLINTETVPCAVPSHWRVQDMPEAEPLYI